MPIVEMGVVEAAHYWHVSTKTVERRLKARKLDARRDRNGKWLIAIEVEDAHPPDVPENSSVSALSVSPLSVEEFRVSLMSDVSDALSAGLSEHGALIQRMEERLESLACSLGNALEQSYELNRLRQENDRLRQELEETRKPLWKKILGRHR